ncbi:MAG: hypothetical protein RLP44_20485 [Aggregatilineales bacterium]
MLDTLNLDEYVKLGKTYQRMNRKPLRRTLWVAVPILIIALMIWLNYKDAPGGVYTLENGAWQEVDVPFSGLPIRVEHSSTGLMWVATDMSDGIHRFDGEGWASFSANDMGIDTRDKLYAFETNSDELWLAAGGSISHFADDMWTTYEDVYDYNARSDLLNIVASDQGVVLTIDRQESGQLFHFEDGSWEVVDRVNTLNIDPNRAENSVPRVFEEEDGTIWMYDLGVFRLEEGEWTTFSLLKNAPLFAISVSSYGVVMMDQQSIGEFPFDSDPRTVRFSQIGISDFRQFTSINTTPEGIIFTTTTNEIWRLSLDNGNWEQLPTLIAPYSIKDMTTDVNGNLWLVANDDSATTAFFLLPAQSFIPTCMPVFLFLIFLYFLTGNRGIIGRRGSARAKLQEIFPDLTVYQPTSQPNEKSPRRGFWIFVVFLIVIIVLPIVDIGSPSTPLILLFLFFLWGAISPLIRSFNKSLTRENRARLRRSSVNTFVIIVLLVALPFGILSVLPSNGFITIVVMIFAYIVIIYGVVLFPFQVVTRLAIGKGDYDKADAWIARFKKISLNYSTMTNITALNNYYRGDLDSAGQYYWQTLEEMPINSPSTLSIMLTNLASVEEDTDRKLLFLVESVKMYPESPAPYSRLALFYLDQNIQPERALEVTDAMMNFAPRKPLRLQLTLNYTWYIVLIVRAWALANVAHFDEANDLLKRVMDVMVDNFYPLNAWIYTIAGHIKRLESQIEDASAYYQRAATLDPNGLHGRQAAQALSDLSSTVD